MLRKVLYGFKLYRSVQIIVLEKQNNFSVVTKNIPLFPTLALISILYKFSDNPCPDSVIIAHWFESKISLRLQI